jgi:hypothetical protein
MHCDPDKVRLVCKKIYLEPKHLPKLQPDVKIDFTKFMRDKLTSNFVADNTELFFAEERNGFRYLEIYGFVATLKLYNQYGFNFNLDIPENSSGIMSMFFDPKTKYRCMLRDEDFTLESIEYIANNYCYDFNYSEYVLCMLMRAYCCKWKNESEMLCILEQCINLGADMDFVRENLEQHLISKDNQNNRWDIIIVFVNNAIIGLDINKLICAWMMDDSLYIDSDAYKIVEKCKLDYSEQLVIEFALECSPILSVEAFMQTLDTIDAQGFYDASQHANKVVSGICSLIRCHDLFDEPNSCYNPSDHYRLTSRAQQQEFIESFLKYNIDIHQMFDNYIENANTNIQSDILITHDLLKYLAIRKDLVSDD